MLWRTETPLNGLRYHQQIYTPAPTSVFLGKSYKNINVRLSISSPALLCSDGSMSLSSSC